MEEPIHREVENTIPILPVRDVRRSIDFYTNTLGFKLDWGGAADRIASVSRDGCSIMLMQDDEFSGPSWVWIGLESDKLFDQFRASGVTVVHEPRNRPWAYEMKLADPDGNVLWLGTEPRGDMPFEENEWSNG
jgi:predicted lactoylglutathione lyase